MSPPLRSFLAVLAGCVAGFFHIAAIQAVGMLIYRPPAGLDPNKPETIAAYLKVIPVGALLMVWLAYVAGTFAGAWLAARLAPISKRAHGLFIGGLFTLITVANLASFPHPAWFWALCLATILPAAYFGSSLAVKPIEPAPSPLIDERNRPRTEP